MKLNKIQGDIGTILDSWYDNKKEEDIENKIICCF